MIPDHLIDKALDAWIGDHNCPHPDLIRAYRVLVTRSLEAVAADIWDEGRRAEANAAHHTNWSEAYRDQVRTNPYRASEEN